MYKFTDYRHFIISVKGPVFPVIKSGDTNMSTVYYQTSNNQRLGSAGDNDQPNAFAPSLRFT